MNWFGLAAIALLATQLNSSAASNNSAGGVTPELNPDANRKPTLSHSFATGGEAEGAARLNNSSRSEEAWASGKKRHAIVDCRKNDLEAIRRLLLRTPEYPVKYAPSTMRHFYETPRFPDMCVVAREILDDANEDTEETEAESDSDTESRKSGLGRIVGVVGAGEARKGSANIMMVAVDKDFRRMGIAKAMLKSVLMKASRFSLSHTNGSVLKEAMLHVWVPQLAPVQLYLSLGFVPTKYLRSYYHEQVVSAGYEMHLPLPYENAEDRLAFDLNLRDFYSFAHCNALLLREMRLKQLEEMWKGRSAAGGLPSLAVLRKSFFCANLKRVQFSLVCHQHEHKGLGMTTFVSVSADTRILPSLKLFLQRAAPKGSDVNAILHEITKPTLSQLSFAAVEGNGSVTGAIWVRSTFDHGIVEGTAVLVEADKDGYKFLSLFHKLLIEASQRGDVHAVRHKMYCDDVQTLALSWKLGFHPVSFAPVPNRRRLGFSTYEYSMEVKLPWTPSQELSLFERIHQLDREIVERERLLIEGVSGSPHTVNAAPFSSSSLSISSENQQTEISPKTLRTEVQLPVQPAGAPDEPESSSAAAAVARVEDENKMNSEDNTLSEEGDALPWYRTVAGVACMLFTSSLLMFLCFRSCAKRGDFTAGSTSTSQGGSSRGSSRDSGSRTGGNFQEPQRRPIGQKEGYAHVTDEQGAAEAQTHAWWDQEDNETFNDP
ncbi:hypothetical protein Esti_003713 [Eimeria stiedai]